MVLIPSQLSSTLTLNSQTANISSKPLTLGQILVANIQPIKASEVKLTIGEQSFIAKTKQPINESGTIQVRVKQLTPEIQLSIVKNSAQETKAQANQQTVQTALRQFIPTQAPISQTIQQINLLQSLPPSLQAPLQSLINQLTKHEGQLDGKALKDKLLNSGLFLESKLKNGVQTHDKTSLKNDVKAQLLQLQQQAERIQLGQSNNTTLNKLSLLLNQAISRITVQQIQLFENPAMTPLNLPQEKDQAFEDGRIEIYRKQNNDTPFWEVFIDLSLDDGLFAGKLKLTEEDQLSCYIWCENASLQARIESSLSQLKERLQNQGFSSLNLQTVPNKPPRSEQSIKVALIDIKV